MQARTFFFILGTAALSAAQNITVPANITGVVDSVPYCAVGCLAEAAAISGCVTTDYACQCANYATIQAASEACLEARCAAVDIANTRAATFEICEDLLIEQLPACSTQCITAGAAEAGCAQDDAACLCSHAADLQSDFATCLGEFCAPSDAIAAETISASLCDLVDESGAGAPSMAPNSTFPSNISITAIVEVDWYTTWCPGPTVFTVNGHGYTATGPTMMTVTDCPCSITQVEHLKESATSVSFASWSNATWSNSTWTTGATEGSGTATTAEATETAATTWTGTTETTGNAVATATAQVTKTAQVAGTTKGASEGTSSPYSQSGAAERQAGAMVALAVVFASIFIMGL